MFTCLVRFISRPEVSERREVMVPELQQYICVWRSLSFLQDKIKGAYCTALGPASAYSFDHSHNLFGF